MGNPLSNATCSAATLLAPYPSRERWSMSVVGARVGWVSRIGSSKRGGVSELTWLPAAST